MPFPLAVADLSPWLAGAVALLGGVAAGVLGTTAWAQRRWERPTRELTRAAADIAAGRWDVRSSVAPTAAYELRRLAGVIDRIADAAAGRFAALSERSANLKLLVDALPDPILVSDAQDRIVLINAPAERLLQLPPQQVVGRPFVAAVNDLAILDLFEHCTHQRTAGGGGAGHGAHGPACRPVDREIRLLRRGQRLQFQAHAEGTARGGVLIVLRDVSTLAATIQMKTDFVANASHELRTPISAIKVAFETLRECWRDDDPALGERCVEIIEGHMGRLEDMLRDLLDLSRVENPELRPQLAPVDVGELVTVLRSIWQRVADDRGVTLALPDGEATRLSFVSDRRLMDLVLKNLIENALKFTPPGGRVGVAFEPRDDAAVAVVVSDTGCGIPAEHVERVFERFYQVDAARSGSAGRGTGLGLAIVKHAVAALGGTVRIDSTPGKGTTVTCTLPQREMADAAPLTRP